MIQHETEGLQEAHYIPFAAVADYRSASQDGDPSLYPGERPDESYVTDGSDLFNLKVTAEHDGLRFQIPTEDGESDLNGYLAAHGVAPIEDRIPMLAFGANAAPGSLAKKFAKDVTSVGGMPSIDNRPDLSIIPTIYGDLAGHDVVWSGGPGMNGNFIAILYNGAEAQNTTVQVGVNFLTQEQVLIMHATEMAYQLSSVEVMVAGKSMRTYYYAGVDSVYVQDGHPIAIESIQATNRELVTSATEQMIQGVLRDKKVMATLAKEYPELVSITNPADYYAFVKSLKSKNGSQPRTALKKAVHAALATSGKSTTTNTADSGRDGYESWANTSTLLTYGQQQQGAKPKDVYVLPSQVLSKDTWANPDARNKVLRAVGTHLLRMSGGQLVETKNQENK